MDLGQALWYIFLQESYLKNLGETRSTADCTVDLGPMTTPLVDILRGLKQNTFAWAKLWVLNGAPDEFYPNEHHIITAALIPFRARYETRLRKSSTTCNNS